MNLDNPAKALILSLLMTIIPILILRLQYFEQNFISQMVKFKNLSQKIMKMQLLFLNQDSWVIKRFIKPQKKK
ncbi:unnamed protein product [Paramecium sonneborni]|uniref:Uncharacterized protein n=1 Tax=Paramecium sonneborni TaxID=65129 RepID=A0A8S1PZL5_9CILI|nr:unnamed protein product [Paramecium sonneborni]